MNEKEAAIEVENLVMAFGKFRAVDGLNLRIQKGSAMALLGENGAGKTTTLRVLAGLYRAQSGSGTVLGHSLGDDSSAFFQRLGYVSENQQLPLNWTLKRYLDYLKPLYPQWDDAFCEELRMNFELPMGRKLGHLSRGMQMKAALIGSLSYRPELLLLDEPFSGLDPLVREELIDGILELMDGGEWTILLSSHDIHEVERLCDSVTMIEHGKVTVSESLDSLQGRFRKWTVETREVTSGSDFPREWILQEQHNETRWSFVDTAYDGSMEDVERVFGSLVTHESHGMSLRDIYLALAREKKQQRRQRVTSLVK